MGVEADFFEVEGILLEGGAAVFSGSADPSIALLQAPVGSMYLRTDGTTWKKIGPLQNEWQMEQLQSTAIDRNLDGGGAFTVYAPSTSFDGGGA